MKSNGTVTYFQSTRHAYTHTGVPFSLYRQRKLETTTLTTTATTTTTTSATATNITCQKNSNANHSKKAAADPTHKRMDVWLNETTIMWIRKIHNEAKKKKTNVHTTEPTQTWTVQYGVHLCECMRAAFVCMRLPFRGVSEWIGCLCVSVCAKWSHRFFSLFFSLFVYVHGITLVDTHTISFALSPSIYIDTFSSSLLFTFLPSPWGNNFC